MRTAAVALAAAAVAASACTSGGSAPPAAPPSSSAPASSASSPSATRPPAATAVWPTYHGDNRRTGFADLPPLRSSLHRAWSRDLDGAVYAQPIVVGATAIVATENNTVYALDLDTGKVAWQRHLAPPVPGSALPCGNIDPTGITGTPAYDASTGNVFVVTETTDSRHDLRALDVRTGRQQWQRNLDVIPGRDPHAEQQRGALLVANDRVYVMFGGRAGDCGDYVGYVTAVSTNGRGNVATYAVPTSREAGMWAPPGPVQGTAGDDVYVASGNGEQTAGEYDGSDSVIRLTPQLRKVALFAPSTWASDNTADLDLGSMAPVVLPSGDVVIAGKRGIVYLLDPDLGGVGGERAQLAGCSAYGGAATVETVVVLPCDAGIRRLDVSAGRMTWRWQVDGVGGSPVIARNVVYSLDQDDGDLVVVSLDNGREVARADVGEVSRFATPVPAGRLVLVGTTSGIVAVTGN